MVDVRMYTREGCRGGREQFKWDHLKEQEFKDREQYLGVSTKVGLMAKFGRYYVHDWYAKKRDTTESIEDERQVVQQFEEELMQEALGLKPKKLLLAKKQLTEAELKEFLKQDSEKRTDQKGREQMGPQRKTMTDAAGQEVAPDELFTDARINGLGFAAHRNAKLEKYKAETLGTEAKLEGIKYEIKKEVKDEPMTDTECLRLGPPILGGSSSSSMKKEEEGAALKTEVKDEPAQIPVGKRRHEDEDEVETKHRRAEKKSKKQKKAEKKAKKKVKKAAKKEKKAAKRAAKVAAARKASSGSSDSSGSSAS